MFCLSAISIDFSFKISNHFLPSKLLIAQSKPPLFPSDIFWWPSTWSLCLHPCLMSSVFNIAARGILLKASQIGSLLCQNSPLASLPHWEWKPESSSWSSRPFTICPCSTHFPLALPAPPHCPVFYNANLPQTAWPQSFCACPLPGPGILSPQKSS